MKKDLDQKTLDRHQALYAGGYGHAPYHEIVTRGGGGYGPMQWPTALAIMTWQLGREYGIEPEHPGNEEGFGFFENGTTKAGRIAYGGEFTLNNGPVDTAGWQANTNNGFSTPKLRVHGASGENVRSVQGSRLPQPASGQLRAFHNTDRSKSIEASLVVFDPASGRVKVRLRNGGIRELPIDSLSQEDQEYVRKESAGQP